MTATTWLKCAFAGLLLVWTAGLGALVALMFTAKTPQVTTAWGCLAFLWIFVPAILALVPMKDGVQ